MSEAPPAVRVAVTGAAGQIGYALLFRIASGQMLGEQQPIILHLLEVPAAMQALEGVVMEINDCAFPLVQDCVLSDDPAQAFRDVQYALLVGSKPRTAGMERSDLLTENGGIFKVQGQALNSHAARDVKVLVVGNPANSNAWAAMQNAPDLPPRNFAALTRLDHNRALAQLAAKLNCPVADLRRLTIWGNHSTTQYPDLAHVTVRGQPLKEWLVTEQDWYRQEYIPRVARRGAEIIAARGSSSAASAANAAVAHIRDWIMGTPEGDWTSMAVASDGSYGIPAGLVYSFPVRCHGGDYQIITDLAIDHFSRQMMQATRTELEQEREVMATL